LWLDPSERREQARRAFARVVACLTGVQHDPIDHRHNRSISNDAWTTRSSAVHLD
jgi:hypothetical protein